MLRFFILTLSLLSLSIARAADDEQRLTRWAVLATDEVVESGLPDLLTAELSRQPSLELVERESLPAVTGELQLQALVQADHVSQRLQLGKTLRANALMVLSFARKAGQQQLRVVVCDADLGVRLWQGSFAQDDNSDIEKLVQRCAATVDEVRQRFAGGVRSIIAVPTFLSEDFALRYEYLQAHCSNLLRNSLMTHAGVAVVEIEEARAILRELEDTFSGKLDRPIATIVKATYRVTTQDNQAFINLNIDLAQADDQREQLKIRRELNAVGPWLAQDLTEHLLRTSESRAPALSAKAQLEILSRHAQRFAELGDWEQSISLREAALVLDPNDALQRALLISEYQYRLHNAVEQNWQRARFAKPLPVQSRERALRLAAHDYCRGLEHLGYLIRNRLIHRVDAIGIFGKHTWYRPPYLLGTASPLDSLKFDCLQSACLAQREFLRDVYPLVTELAAGRVLPKYLSEPFYGQRYVVTNHVVSDVSFNNFSAQSLASLRNLLSQILPADDATSNSMLGLLSFAYVPKPGEAKFAAWQELWQGLKDSDRDLARLYARFALGVSRQRQSSSTAALVRLLAEVEQLGRTDEPIYDVINRKLMRHPPQPRTAPTAPLPRGFGPLGRLHLEPISLRVEGDEPGAEPPLIIGMLRCGPQDVYWSKDRFFVMQQPNVLREWKLTDLSAPHTLFWEVSWDGEYIWLQAYGQGILVLRPDGTRLATFKGQTPSYSRGHKLLGISPRRALMVGSFGATNRAWCALLEVDEQDHPSVNVCFEAKQVAAGRSQQQAAADLETAFVPEQLHRVQHADGKQYVLVDRAGLSRLQIDLETLEASIAKQVSHMAGVSTQTDLGFSGRLFLRDGQPLRVRSGVAITPNSKRLIFHDDWLYRPGAVWMRQHTKTGKLERLQAGRLQQRYMNLRVGSSAHYGLITYDPHNRVPPISRVTILDEPVTGQPPHAPKF
jgi:hypothetical protein